MRRHRRRGEFWQRWREAQRDSQEEPSPTANPHVIWRRFIGQFFGIPIEKHWLFRGRRFKPWVTGRLGPPILFNPFIAEVLSRGGGLLSLYILHLLSEKPRFGNDIMRAIVDRTDGRWISNPGAVYPILASMEERGLVEGEWEEPTKRTRRIYQLTEAGEQELKRLKAVMRPMLEEAIGILHGLNEDLQEP